MAIITLPVETKLIRTTNAGMPSACGGNLASSTDLYRMSLTRQAYRDSLHAIKMQLGIQSQMMPFQFTRLVTYQQPAPRSTGSSNVFVGACYGPGSDYGLSTELKALALSEANRVYYEKLRETSSFNLGVALAEAKQTFGLIANTAIRLNTVFKSLRKGKIQRAFDVLGVPRSLKLNGKLLSSKNQKPLRTAGSHIDDLKLRLRGGTYKASQAWLEMSYGWTPLLSDIYGGAEFVAKLLNSTSNDIYIKAHSGPITGNRTGSNVNAYDYASATCTAKWAVGLKIVSQTLRNMSSLGLTNPLLIAWEKVPFSFVVDWFYPVGAWAESLTAMQGLSINEKSLTTCIESRIERYTQPTNTFVKNGFQAVHTVDQFDLRRVTNVTPSIVSPRLNIFDAVGGKRLASALSLLRSGFSHRI